MATGGAERTVKRSVGKMNRRAQESGYLQRAGGGTLRPASGDVVAVQTVFVYGAFA